MKLTMLMVLVASLAGSGLSESAASRKATAMRMGDDIKVSIDQAVQQLRQARQKFPELGQPVERATSSIEILGRAIQNVFLNLENPYFNRTEPVAHKEGRPRVWKGYTGGPRREGFTSEPKRPGYKF